MAPAAGVGSGQVRLSWTAPYAPAAITDYIIEYCDGNLWTTTRDGVSTATTYTVGGLKNGSSYPFRVKAKTFMEGPVSEVSATPLWAPDAPDWLIAITWPAAAPGTFEADLTWATRRGQRVGRHRLRHRMVRRQDDLDEGRRRRVDGNDLHGARDWRLGRTTPSGSRPRTRSGPAAGATGHATPATEPATPSGLAAAVAPAAGVGSGQVKLSWTAPSTNGSPITDYLIERALDGTTWTTVSDGVSTATGSPVSGLTNGTPYSFRVSADQRWAPVRRAPRSGDPGVDGGRTRRLSAAVAPANGVGSGQVR